MMLAANSNKKKRRFRIAGGDMSRLPDKEFFRADEVMKLFGFKTVKTVYRWIRTGRLKYIVTPGGRKRITRSEIERIAREIQNDPEMLRE
jgi:hypothetical protein